MTRLAVIERSTLVAWPLVPSSGSSIFLDWAGEFGVCDLFAVDPGALENRLVEHQVSIRISDPVRLIDSIDQRKCDIQIRE